jgi:hypothetical protein
VTAVAVLTVVIGLVFLLVWAAVVALYVWLERGTFRTVIEASDEAVDV